MKGVRILHVRVSVLRPCFSNSYPDVVSFVEYVREFVQASLQSTSHDTGICMREIDFGVFVGDEVGTVAARVSLDAQSYRAALDGLVSVWVVLVELKRVRDWTVGELEIITLYMCSAGNDSKRNYNVGNPSNHLASFCKSDVQNWIMQSFLLTPDSSRIYTYPGTHA